jgi:acetylornithine deacetylase/succinyl-diaminopimelate desuccinylase-like protein
MDTVQADKDKWDTDPFEAHVKDGKLYGLGASDIQGSIAALVKTAEILCEKDLDVDLYFDLVVNEEVDGAGSRRLMEEHDYDYVDEACVLTEPTSLESVELGCRGNYFVKIETEGESCHGSRPENGENAILKMKDVVEEIQEYSEDIKKHENEDLGTPSVAVATTIQGGDSVNKVPTDCKITCDIRTIPEFHSEAFSQLKERLDSAKVGLVSDPTPPSYTGKDQEIARISREVIDGEFDVSEGADDSSFYEEQGINTVVLGPGNKEVIHGANEYIHLSKLYESVGVYVEIASRYSN